MTAQPEPLSGPETVTTSPVRRKQAYERALAQLARVKQLRQWRAKYLRIAYRLYGDHGPLISGCERAHWPEPAKDALRENARDIADTLDRARDEWRAARKRQHTWLRTMEQYRVDGCRY
jgi:hypothetical protein